MTAAVRRRRAIALTAALAAASSGAWAAAPGQGDKPAKAGMSATASTPVVAPKPAVAPKAAPALKAGPKRAAPKATAGPRVATPTPGVAGLTEPPSSQIEPPGQSEDKQPKADPSGLSGSNRPQGQQALAVSDAKQAGRSPKKATRLRTASPTATPATTTPTAQASATPTAAAPVIAPVTDPPTSASPPAQPDPVTRPARPGGRVTAPTSGPTAFGSDAAPLALTPSAAALTDSDAGSATRGPRAEQRPDAKPAAPRTITRTITRVLELVPPAVWLAIGALAVLGIILALATAVQTVRRRRLEAVRQALVADVGVLQSVLLPVLPGEIGGATLTAAYRPAEGLAAGGDFFDAFELYGGRTAVIVGDVAGHGREVVPLTAAVRYSLRAYLEAGLSPRAVLNVAGNVLAGQLAGRQVTVIVAIHDPKSGHLTYACAGHWPPLILGVPGTAVTACSSPPLGAGLPTGRRQTTVAMGPGSVACFFTDGLTDVVVPDGRLGLHGLRSEIEALGPDRSAQQILERVVAVSEGQPDDMAACVLVPLAPPAEAEPLRVDELEVDTAALAGSRVGRFLRSGGVEEADTAHVLEQARLVCERAGGAVVAVRTDGDGVTVRVTEPVTATLRLAARRADAEAVAA